MTLPIICTITAFANDFDNMGGEYIFIGVEDEKGRPVLPLKGLYPDAIDGIQLNLMNKCNFIEPHYIPVIEPYTIDGKEILVLWITGEKEQAKRLAAEGIEVNGGKVDLIKYGWQSN